eukprot:SAG31_NODE_6086_length_2178_cov_1.504570_2_plen_407_part_00
MLFAVARLEDRIDAQRAANKALAKEVHNLLETTFGGQHAVGGMLGPPPSSLIPAAVDTALSPKSTPTTRPALLQPSHADRSPAHQNLAAFMASLAQIQSAELTVDEGDCQKSVVRTHMDWKGGDLGGPLHVDSSTSCSSACWKDVRCSKWVYYEEGGDKFCWLKNNEADKIAGGPHLLSGELDKSFSRENADPLDCWYSSISTRLPKAINELTGLHGTVVDVGANVGAFSAAIRQKCANCNIVMFEAVPDYAAYCEKHKDKHMTVVHRGLSNQKGNASIWVSKDPGNRGWNTMVETEVDKEQMREQLVNFVTFDWWIETASIEEAEISLIKIDTEGAEWRVLNGMRGFLERVNPKPTLLIEVAWGPGNHPNWKDEMETFEWLFAHGYARNDVANIQGTTDVLFVPS